MIDSFRGRTQSGEWVQGAHFCLHHNDERTHVHHFIIPDNAPIPKDKAIGEIQVEVVEPTIGRKFELPDIKGKDMYDGDIVSLNANIDDQAIVRFGKFQAVDFENEQQLEDVYGWYLEPLPSATLPNCDPFMWPVQLNEYRVKEDKVVVIGNIFDNPEMANGTK